MASESLAYSNGGLALRASFVVPSWINFPSISLNRDRNSDVVLGKSDEPTCIDDGIRDRRVAANNQVIDKTDPASSYLHSAPRRSYGMISLVTDLI